MLMQGVPKFKFCLDPRDITLIVFQLLYPSNQQKNYSADAQCHITRLGILYMIKQIFP